MDLFIKMMKIGGGVGEFYIERETKRNKTRVFDGKSKFQKPSSPNLIHKIK